MVKTMMPHDCDIDWWQRMLRPAEVEPAFFDGLWLPHLIWRWRDFEVAMDTGMPQGVGTWEYVARLWLLLTTTYNADGDVSI